LQEGVEAALKKHGPNAKVVVVPDGPYVMPIVERQQLANSEW
jgi:nickel-dependent lactate racemase